MDKYLIALVPEFEENRISSDDLLKFVENRSDIKVINEKSFTLSDGCTVKKTGLLWLQYCPSENQKKFYIKYDWSTGMIVTEYDPLTLNFLGELGKSLSFPTYIRGENSEEY